MCQLFVRQFDVFHHEVVSVIREAAKGNCDIKEWVKARISGCTVNGVQGHISQHTVRECELGTSIGAFEIEYKPEFLDSGA